jgi:hypothetical protein
MAVGALTFLVMLVALILPIKAFFWRSANSTAVDEHHNESKSPATGLKYQNAQPTGSTTRIRY